MYIYDECNDGVISNARGMFKASMCINSVSHESTIANS